MQTVSSNYKVKWAKVLASCCPSNAMVPSKLPAYQQDLDYINFIPKSSSLPPFSDVIESHYDVAHVLLYHGDVIISYCSDYII